MFDALVLIASPVRGFLALRARSLTTLKEPKPISWTFLFFLSDTVMVPRIAARVSLAAFLVEPVPAWITSMRWSLLTTPAGVALRLIRLPHAEPLSLRAALLDGALAVQVSS